MKISKQDCGGNINGRKYEGNIVPIFNFNFIKLLDGGGEIKSDNNIIIISDFKLEDGNG